jgi:3-phenylpropionate/trans-cinnamate dioxygenase ferredoxin reductase subunit
MTPPEADLLIVGGGLAAQRCSETLRRLGFDGRIVMVCEEPSAPYDRPPLSKAVLADEHPTHDLAFRPPAWYAEHDVELLLGVAARELEAATRTILAHDGRRLRYRRLVIATGSRPRRLPGLPLGGVVHELRTHADALTLRAALRRGGGRLLVVGAGLVGMEVASSARALGMDVTLIEAGPTPLARALPPGLGHWIAGLHRRHGVDVRLGTSVERMSLHASAARLELSDGTALDAEAVLVAAGTAPATEWLTASGLGPGPIATDAGGRTGVPGVYAAGDAACFPDPHSGERIPTQHWEAAVRQGVAVARAIVGLEPAPSQPPMFWSDQHGCRIQMVGHAPQDCEIELDGDPAGGPFAAWITGRERPSAALLVDRQDALPRARRWIAAGRAEPPEERLLDTDNQDQIEVTR